MPSKNSYITNCIIMGRGDVPHLFYFGKKNRVYLDGYLIAPRELFTEKQINAAAKKLQKLKEGRDRTEDAGGTK